MNLAGQRFGLTGALMLALGVLAIGLSSHSALSAEAVADQSGAHPEILANAATDSVPATGSRTYARSATGNAAASSRPDHWPDVVRAASVYALYRAEIRRAAETPPASAEDLERVITQLAAYDGARLSRSFRAHAVLLAMQTPVFAAGVQQWGKAYDRRVIISNLRNNAAYANRIPGYRQAVARVLDAAREEGENVVLTGSIYKDLAYSLQHRKWATRVRRSKSLLLAAVRNAAATPPAIPAPLLGTLRRDYTRALQPPDAEAVKMTSAGLSVGKVISPLVRSIGPDPANAATPPDAAVKRRLVVNPAHLGQVQDIVASAAIHILDSTAPFPDTALRRRGSDTLAECVDWARMHLNQCVAATHYVYEDSFCIAEHQLKDTGSCIADFTVSQ